MLKQTVQYEDYDGVNRTTILMFNLTRMEIIENIELRNKLKSIEPIVEAAEHEMTQEEIVEVLAMVKMLAKAAYGIREGDRFIKSEDAWTEFTQRPVYDAFLFQIFDGTINPSEFINALMPRVLREEIAKQDSESTGIRSVLNDSQPANYQNLAPVAPPDRIAKYEQKAPSEEQHFQVNEDLAPQPAPEVVDDRPEWLQMGREPTDAEMRVATKEQMFEAFRLRSSR